MNKLLRRPAAFLAAWVLLRLSTATAAPPLVPSAVEFCGTMQAWERTADGLAYKARMDLTGSCPTNGPCDGSANRDAKIPGPATPFKVVPVRFQIFANDDGSNPGGTSLEISNQMALLNIAYAPSRIFFIYSARTNLSTLYRTCPSNSEPAMMAAYAESPASQINVFVTRYAGFNNCGIATLPWTSSSLTSTGGLMLQDLSLAPARFGYAASLIECFPHEMGHMLGLWHTFHGVLEVATCQNCRELVGRSAADGNLSGDFCSDTPPDPGYSSLSAPCAFPATNDVCNAQPFSTNVVLFNNFMSYYIACYSAFTPQQMGRMHCWAENVLSSWLINDFTPPSVAITAPTNGDSFTSLNAIAGWATDNYLLLSVGVALKEVEPSGGTGRWWNGTNWQGSVFLLPTTLTGTNWMLAGGVVLPPLNSGISYQITATAVDEQFNAASTSVTVSKPIEVLTWDPGTTHLGTQVKNSPHQYGGPFIYKMTAQNTSVGVWRTALNVSTNEADVYLSYNSPPTTASYYYASSRAGSDGFCLAQGAQFAPAQDWYYLVQTTAGAAWNLVSGEAFVQQLPALAADASSGTNSVMGAEGMRFFNTTISAGTLAWRLGLGGLNNALLVKKTGAPHPYSSGTYDLYQLGQMLVVPSYLNIGDSYFVGVVGVPGQNFTLDSRQQAVTDLAFNSNTNLTLAVNAYGYVTYRVQVPIQQIAWQVNVAPTVGDANVSVRQGNVPNEFVNDAYSDYASASADSVTLVPPVLSDGTWYVTVYGTSPYSCSLTNGQPIITDVHYVFSITNDAPNRVGWRFYRVVNTAEQLGTLGWDLFLTNQVPGTEIALRRNAVPSRWNYRNYPYSVFSGGSQGFVDFSGPNGFLQRPGHQADVWYIGVYQPAAPLGPFVLTGQQLNGPLMAFDPGTGSTNVVVNQPAGKFQYYRIDVPTTNAFGWDLRIQNVLGGDPRLVVRRDQLPDNLGTHEVSGCCYWSWQYGTTWPSGYQLGVPVDWTSYPYDPNGTNQDGHVLEIGMGNPLEPGTYYVGVLNGGGPGNLNPMSYTLVSRGIGTNVAIPIADLAWSNGVVSVGGLAARAANYYRVQVPSNAPSWKVKLSATAGESLLLIQRTALPNTAAYGSAPAAALYGGKKMQKAGNEIYMMLPDNGESNITAGTYYFAVVGEGNNPGGGFVGSGTSSYTLTTYGSIGITNLGTLDATGLTDLVHTNSNEGGEAKPYRFTVAPGTLALEVRLENREGNPVMTLRPDAQLPYAYEGYGRDGGQYPFWQDAALINMANPAPGTYTLMVSAVYFNSGYSNAAYTIRVKALTATPIAFDGGALPVVAQDYGHWRYFSLTVPSNAFGWDLRLTNITAGDPRLAIERELRPDGLYSRIDNPCCYWNWNYASTWPTGYQFGASYDWTGENANNGGSEYGRIAQFGMGNPLEPGRYFIGVFSGGGGGALPMSYSLASRGIGTNFTIPIGTLNFSNGVVSSNNLPAREVAYYRVEVPSNMPSWKVQLRPTSGEALLMLQRDHLPNPAAYQGSHAATLSGGKKMQKPGHDPYLMLPDAGQTNIQAGTYYIAVASEGQDPFYPYAYIGTNGSSFTVQSIGTIGITNLGTVDSSGATDLTRNDGMEGAESRVYQFIVPPGTLSLEVRLDNREGNPLMTLRNDEKIPYAYEAFGRDGGEYPQWTDADLINLANPATGLYTLTVSAAYFSTGYSNTSYTVRVHALGTIPVAFDGGSATIVNQAQDNWQYFIVNVPSNAFGWDLRLTNVTSGDPRLAVRRSVLPDALYSHVDNLCCYWNWNYANAWPTGYQSAATYDWTGFNGTNGANEYGRLLQMGLGNPLEPGLYYVGVLNGAAGPMSYTLASRGIGTNLSIPIVTIPFNGGLATNTGLAAREAAYYCVVVPTNTPSWKLRLATTSGDALLMVQKDFLPNVGAYQGFNSFDLSGGKRMSKDGNEQYLELPPSYSYATNIPAGTYYIAVASEGVNAVRGNSWIGYGNTSFSLKSQGTLGVTNLGVAGGADLVRAQSIEGAETRLYRFSIPPGTPGVEVRLDGRAGNPYMSLRPDSFAPTTIDSFARDGGEYYFWQSPNLITLPNPTATNYTLCVFAAYHGPAGTYSDADYTVVVHTLPTPALNFDAQFNTNGFSNIASNTLADNARAFYKVIVPTNFNGAPVLGWKLDLSQTLGTPYLRVRKDLLPDDGYYDGTSGFVTGEGVIVAPYLAPGTWFVEVKAVGATSFRLVSSALLLERPAWQMPQVGQSVTTTGLPPSGPLFGDTGVGTNGVALPLDQGTDLEQGNFHYYAVIVPTNNVGAMRTRLDAISGDPNLYIRTGNPPTRTHDVNGNGGELWERTLNGAAGSEYGNWVPADGRFEFYLTPGTWYLAVQASGASNVRYRLRISTGDVQDLALNGSYNGQTIAAGDWRYYRVTMPTNPPVNWNVTFSQQVGDAVMYLRDRVPPGCVSYTTDYRDWNNDAKNHGPYPSYDPAGSYTFNVPPVRPGSFYYIGFRAVNDATFSVSSSTNGAPINFTNVIPFYGGFITNVIPPNGLMRLRVDVPADAYRWRHSATHSNEVSLFLDQGSAPTMTTSDHAYWIGQQNTSFSIYLRSPGYWPWQPAYSYFLAVTNTSGVPQPFSFRMDGRNAATDDEDGDGLPDAWELACFPSIYYYDGNSDPDGDGVNNMEEYLEGTVPCDPNNYHPRLLVNATHGVVTRNPVGGSTLTPPKVWYTNGTAVQLSPAPDPGYSFLGWSGDATGTNNPLTVSLTTNKTVTAIFGINPTTPGADYRFQNTLASSVGTPPDLQNVSAGNSFQTETVDGFARVIYRFPQGNGVFLQPATNTITSNVWSMVLLFRFDDVTSYRRIVDTKNPVSEFGLYVQNGYLYFYPYVAGPGVSILASNYVQVVMTRDETNLVRAYVNGNPQFSFVDNNGDAGISGSPSRVRFFIDNAGENSGGAVARIRLFDHALTPEQVPLLDRLPGNPGGGGGPLHFIYPMYHSNGAFWLTATLTPNFNYQIQASTNLTNWATITNVLSPTSPVLIRDSQVGSWSNRFYRGVTP